MSTPPQFPQHPSPDSRGDGQAPGQGPVQAPGQFPGQVPGPYPGQAPGQFPGQVQGQGQGQAPGYGQGPFAYQGAPEGYQGAPGAYPAQAPMAQGTPAQEVAPARRKSFFARHKVLSVLGIVVLAIIIISVASSLGGKPGPEAAPAPAAGQETEAGEPASAAPQDKAPAAAAIGTPVKAGDFEVTVTKVESGVKQLGKDPITTKPQGQFVLLHLKATNTGSKAAYFDGSSIKLIDTKGREHAPDSGAQVYLGDTEAFLSEVNPGNTASGAVVFDIPADAVPDRAQLPDGLFSDGPEVSLRK